MRVKADGDRDAPGHRELQDWTLEFMAALGTWEPYPATQI
jgi:hypothetical protein